MTAPYTLNFRLRSKNESGTVVSTFQVAPGTGFNIGFGTPEPVVQERTDINLVDESYMLGARNSWTASFLAAGDTKVIPGDSGYSSLEAVLNDGCGVGHELELSTDGGSTWVRVVLDGAPTVGKPQEKNVGKTMELTLKSRTLSNSPLLTS